MTMQLEDRLWEQLEAAADREAARGRAARAGAAARAVLPARRLRAVAGLVVAAALAVLVVAIAPSRDAPRPQLERFAVGGSRIGAAVSGHGALWAVDTHSGAVLRIDPRTHRVLGRIALPGASGGGAIASGTDAVWAVPAAPIRHSAPAPAHPPASTLSRIDEASIRVAERIPLRAPDGATVQPVGLGVVPGAVWVWGEGGALRVDPRRERVVSAIGLPGEKVMGFAATAARVTVITDMLQMVSFDARTGRRLSAVPFDGPLTGSKLVPVGTDVVAYRRGALASVDPATGRERWAVRMPVQPRDLALSGGRLWVLLGDELRALDPGTGRVLARHALQRADASTLAAGGAIPEVTTYAGDVLIVRAPAP